jgi:branched-chain amino acid transport system substrate-binding protein
MNRIVAAVLLAALALPLASPPPLDAQAGPIKIGFLAPLTGPFAQIGKDMVNGSELFLDEIGRQMAGRKVELIVEDTEGQPATALNKSRKLVEQDRVHLLTGGLLANVGYALQPFIDGAQVPATYPVIAADDITQRKPAKWIVRTGWSTSQPMHPFAAWVIKNTKYRRVATIGMDYAFGYETIGGFQRVFEENGGQIVQKLWTPLNTNDFAPFLAQIRRDSDAVLALFVGRLALQFVKQYQEAGLQGKLPLLGGGTTTDESVLPQMGDEALGTVTALHYSQALDTPQNQKFLETPRG